MGLIWNEHREILISAQNMKRHGDEWKGPCPNCGGEDRFWIKQGDSGKLVHECRHCEFRERASIVDEICGVTFKPVDGQSTCRPYHERKGIKLLGAILDEKGNVVVSINNIKTGERVGEQIIKPDGVKMFTKGMKLHGCGLYLGETTEVLYVCEGWSDAVAVHTSTGHQAVWVLNANQLPKTVGLLDHDNIIIAADNDAAGIQAAIKSNKPYSMPAKHKDWCDVYQAEGPEAVMEGLKTIHEAGKEPSFGVGSLENNAETQNWPTPYDAFDGSALPPREWVYGRDYIKKYISVTASAGGLGKTSLTIAETLSMVTGKPLLGITPKQKEKVWLINLEDPRQELERRTIAAMQHYCLQPDEVRGNLFMDGEDTMDMTLAMEGRDGFVQNDALLQFMIGKIKENAIGVVIIDPFVSAHLVNENNNGSIQAVVSMLRQLARDTNTAVQLVHHIRKTNGEDATIDSVRGAGSLIGAARAARVINRIKPEDAMELGVEEHEALGIFRVDDGKSNLLPPADKAIYRRMKSVQIRNGENIGVAIEFKLPDAFDGVTRRHLYNLQRVLGSADDKDDAEQAYRENVQADNWVGKAVAEEVGLDLEQAHEKARVKKMLKAWIRSGALKIVKLPQKSKDRDAPCVVVGEWVHHDEI